MWEKTIVIPERMPKRLAPETMMVSNARRMNLVCREIAVGATGELVIMSVENLPGF
jgi:hypothetical protein